MYDCLNLPVICQYSKTFESCFSFCCEYLLC